MTLLQTLRWRAFPEWRDMPHATDGNWVDKRLALAVLDDLYLHIGGWKAGLVAGQIKAYRQRIADDE